MAGSAQALPALPRSSLRTFIPPLPPSTATLPGSIITEAFASTMPTLVAFVIDTPRCAAPQTFMTNMLQVGDRLASVVCHWHVMLRCSAPRTFRTNVMWPAA